MLLTIKEEQEETDSGSYFITAKAKDGQKSKKRSTTAGFEPARPKPIADKYSSLMDVLEQILVTK